MGLARGPEVAVRRIGSTSPEAPDKSAISPSAAPRRSRPPGRPCGCTRRRRTRALSQSLDGTVPGGATAGAAVPPPPGGRSGWGSCARLRRLLHLDGPAALPPPPEPFVPRGYDTAPPRPGGKG